MEIDIITVLKKYPSTLTNFTKHLIDNKHNYSRILQSKCIAEVLGYYIDYFNKNNLYICLFAGGYFICHYKHIETYDVTKHKLIKNEDMPDKSSDIIAFKCITEVFNYLEYPF